MKKIEKFEELNISPESKKALKDMNLSEMFPIQIEAIPKILKGRDIIGQAQTGTGKTAAFAIPIIEQINTKQKHTQAIVIAPTRELAVQVSNEIKKLGKYKKISVLSVYGGVSIDKQADVLRRGVHVVVGTPGRLIDQMNRRNLILNAVKIVVLDEADRMLDMGFIEDMRFILEKVPKKHQTLLFSATMPDSILNLAKDYMNNPEVIQVSKDELTVKDTDQVYCEVNYYNKIKTLKAILSKEKIKSAIIFCNTKIGVDRLVDVLKRDGYHTEALHGNFSQSRRNKVLLNFRQGRFNILVATDVAARGLDIKGVSHIINYDIPRDPKDYVHRIGRTGRAGKVGKAIILVSDKNRSLLSSIEWYINMKIRREDYGVEKGKHGEHPRKHYHKRYSTTNKYATGKWASR